MKKSLIALAVLAASGAAMAQSSVTLYGLIDASVQMRKTQSVAATAGSPDLSTTSVSQGVLFSGALNSSRWGLKGKEDLGGGMYAVFNLENGFSVDTGTAGQSGRIFGRKSNVGLSINNVGTLTFGRHQNPYYNAIGNPVATGNNSIDATGGSTSGASIAQLKNIATYKNATTVAAKAAAAGAAATAVNAIGVGGSTGAWIGYNGRFDNSFMFESADWAGFKAAVAYGIGEDKTATASGTHSVSASVEYTNGPIYVVAAMEDAIIYPADANKSSLHNGLLGATYDFGVVKLFGVVNRARFTGVDVQKEYGLGFTVPIGAVSLQAEYARSKGNFFGLNSGFNVQALYDLSKRTTTYVGFVSTKHELLNNERTSAFAVGIRHKF